MQEEPQLLLEEEKEFRRSYRFSLWWVEHRAFLRKLGYGIFIFIDACFFFFVLWTMLDSFAISYGQDELQVAQMVAYGQKDLRAYSVSRSASPINPDEVRVFDLGENRSDFYARLTNSNEDWWVEFTYRFTFDGGNTDAEHSFLLPSESKPVAALAVSTEATVREAQIELSEITWHRIDHHSISDSVTWLRDRLNLEILNPIFSTETGFEKTVFGRTTFTVFNHTAFSYFDPEFIVLLKRGTSVVGVSRVSVQSLMSGEQKEISLNWFGTLPGVSSVEVIADINPFNESVYQRLEGETGIDTRVRK